MRILIHTQAVDIDDPVLGFFHRWLEEFSQHFEFIEVICLKEGRHNLPSNVRVRSLGKENGRSRIKYLLNLYTYLFTTNCDAVFVHMNEEYVILCGWWWRLAGKRVVMWRNFKTGSWMTPLAAKISNFVCYTSPESFTARFSNAMQMPVGIDTDFFSPQQEPPASTILFLGRIDAVKRVEVFVEALKRMQSSFFARLVGSPTEPESAYAKEITQSAQPLLDKGMLSLESSVTNEKARDLYRQNKFYVNLTPSGSFDKTIIEAMSTGAIVICANTALKGILPEQCIVRDEAESAAHGMDWALSLAPAEERQIRDAARTYVVEVHSLKLLAHKLAKIIAL